MSAGRKQNAVVAFALLALMLGAMAFWIASQRRGRAASKRLHAQALELSACVRAATGDAPTLREALELSPPDATLLAGCAPSALAVQREARALSQLPFKRDAEAIREIVATLALLPEARFGERVDALAGGEVESLESGVSSLLKSSCRLVIGEGEAELGACPPPPPPLTNRALPVARVAIDRPAEFIQKAAWSVVPSADGELRLAFTTLERDSDALGVTLARSAERGRRFDVMAGRAGKAEGSPDVPVVSYSGRAPELVLVTRRDDKGAYSGGALARPSASGEALEAVLELPVLPEGLEPLSAGTPIWTSPGKPARVPTLAIGPRDPSRVGGTLVRIEPDGKLALVPVPSGTLVAALHAPRPRVVATGASGLAVHDVPMEGSAWPPAQGVAGAAPGALPAEPAPEASCGPPGAEAFAFAMRQGARASLVSVGPAGAAAASFGVRPESELDPVCGGCAAKMLARAEDQLSLVVLGASGAGSVELAAPLLVTAARAAKRAVATCNGSTLLVAYVVRSRIFVQTGSTSDFRLGRPVLVAAPNERGIPVEVRVASANGRLFVFFRRDQRMRLLVEVLASDDGISWS